MNEPVAELVLEQMAVGDASSLRVKWLTDTYPPVGTKLYTHPVNPKYDPETGEPLIDGYPLFSGLPHPVKELTDEEILECWNESHPAVVCLNAELPLFARAILRKAQDK